MMTLEIKFENLVPSDDYYLIDDYKLTMMIEHHSYQIDRHRQYCQNFDAEETIAADEDEDDDDSAAGDVDDDDKERRESDFVDEDDAVNEMDLSVLLLLLLWQLLRPCWRH